MIKELVLSEIDRLIESHQASADYYRNESRFAEGSERDIYQEARSIHLGIVHDLQQLRRKVDDEQKGFA